MSTVAPVMVNVDPLSPKGLEIMFFVRIHRTTDEVSKQQFEP